MGAGLQMKYLPLLKHVAEQKRFPVSSRCVFYLQRGRGTLSFRCAAQFMPLVQGT